jgi:hypothetical protein
VAPCVGEWVPWRGVPWTNRNLPERTATLEVRGSGRARVRSGSARQPQPSPQSSPPTALARPPSPTFSTGPHKTRNHQSSQGGLIACVPCRPVPSVLFQDRGIRDG